MRRHPQAGQAPLEPPKPPARERGALRLADREQRRRRLVVLVERRRVEATPSAAAPGPWRRCRWRMAAEALVELEIAGELERGEATGALVERLDERGDGGAASLLLRLEERDEHERLHARRARLALDERVVRRRGRVKLDLLARAVERAAAPRTRAARRARGRRRARAPRPPRARARRPPTRRGGASSSLIAHACARATLERGDKRVAPRVAAHTTS